MFLVVDFEASCSKAAVVVGDKAHIIPVDSSFPNIVSFQEGKVSVGERAQRQMSNKNPKNIIFGVSSFFGKKYNDTDVQQKIKKMPYDVVEGKKQKPLIRVFMNDEFTFFYPEEIAAMIIGHLKLEAEKLVGKTITEAIVTCPCGYNELQRESLTMACSIAGLEISRFLETSSAAFLYYQHFHPKKGTFNYLVFDLSSENLNITMATFEFEGVIVVTSTNGKIGIGGNYFVERMVNHFVKIIKKKYDVDISINPHLVNRITTQCHYAMKNLEKYENTSFHLDLKEFEFDGNMDQKTFNELNIDLFEICLSFLEQSIGIIRKNSIDKVLLVGSCSRIPKLRNMIDEYFGRSICDDSIDKTDGVVMGAMIQSKVLTGKYKDLLLLGARGLTIYISNGGTKETIVQRNTTFPLKISVKVKLNKTKSLKIYEGNNENDYENYFLGEFDFSQQSENVEAEIFVEIDANEKLRFYVESKEKINWLCKKNTEDSFNDEQLKEMKEKHNNLMK